MDTRTTLNEWIEIRTHEIAARDESATRHEKFCEESMAKQKMADQAIITKGNNENTSEAICELIQDMKNVAHYNEDNPALIRAKELQRVREENGSLGVDGIIFLVKEREWMNLTKRNTGYCDCNSGIQEEKTLLSKVINSIISGADSNFRSKE